MNHTPQQQQQQHTAYQSNYRLVIKSILYRLIALSVTFIVSLYFTKSYSKSVIIGVITELFQTLIYYTYEIAWNNVQWGYRIV